MRLPGRRGRDEALRRVYHEHLRAAYAFLAYSVPAATAEDLTAATFERVIRAWDRFDPAKASERTWILTIARNLLADHFRRQQHRAAVSLDEHPGLLDALSDDWETRRLSEDELRGGLRTSRSASSRSSRCATAPTCLPRRSRSCSTSVRPTCTRSSRAPPPAAGVGERDGALAGPQRHFGGRHFGATVRQKRQ